MKFLKFKPASGATVNTGIFVLNVLLGVAMLLAGVVKLSFKAVLGLGLFTAAMADATLPN